MQARTFIKIEEALGTDLYEVAEHSKDPKILHMLASHKNYRIRRSVACNGHTLKGTLRKLLKDNEPSVGAWAESSLYKQIILRHSYKHI